MAPEDSKTPFMRIPWAATLLKRPNTIVRVPGSRIFKASTEDSYFAEILKTPRTIRSCISFYQNPNPDMEYVPEVSTLCTLGNGMNGHPNTLHGGVVAALLDEGMGWLQSANNERKHLAAVAKGRAHGEMPPVGVPSYTAELKIRYLRPVQTPGALIVTAKYVKREGRKEWINAEIKQREGMTDDYDGDEVVCATAEALFIEPKPKKNKL